MGSYIWLQLVDVLEHSSVVLPWLLALRLWVILCSNVPILSDFTKQTTLPCLVCPVFLMRTRTHAQHPPSLSSLLICLLYQFNFLWSEGTYPIHILILLKVLGVLIWLRILFSDPQFEYEMWSWNDYFYVVTKMNLWLKIFLSWETQLHHVHCVSWNIQKG